MSKVLDSINEKYSGKLVAQKIDISLTENREIALKFKARYVPHLLFVDAKGEVFKQEIGFIQESDVLKIFEEAGMNI